MTLRPKCWLTPGTAVTAVALLAACSSGGSSSTASSAPASSIPVSKTDYYIPATAAQASGAWFGDNSFEGQFAKLWGE